MERLKLWDLHQVQLAREQSGPTGPTIVAQNAQVDAIGPNATTAAASGKEEVVRNVAG